MATWASCGEVQTNWRRLIWTATALIAGLWYPPPARAGFCTAHRTDRENRHDLQFFAGYSPLSPTLIGTETSRRFVLAGLSYGYRCWTWDSVSISYTAAVMPASILIQPAQHLAGVAAHSVYGFAMAPLGFTFDLGWKHRFHPYVESIDGIIASTEPIPENQPDATGLNFVLEFGAGVRWNVDRRSAVTIGYKFLHISNAGTTRFNPGVDNGVICLGYSFLR